MQHRLVPAPVKCAQNALLVQRGAPARAQKRECRVRMACEDDMIVYVTLARGCADFYGALGV